MWHNKKQNVRKWRGNQTSVIGTTSTDIWWLDILQNHLLKGNNQWECIMQMLYNWSCTVKWKQLGPPQNLHKLSGKAFFTEKYEILCSNTDSLSVKMAVFTQHVRYYPGNHDIMLIESNILHSTRNIISISNEVWWFQAIMPNSILRREMIPW